MGKSSDAPSNSASLHTRYRRRRLSEARSTSTLRLPRLHHGGYSSVSTVKARRRRQFRPVERSGTVRARNGMDTDS